MFEDKSLSTSGGIGSFGRTFANGPVERADNLAVQLPSEDMNIRSETPMPSVADPRLLADFAETAAREPVTFIESRRGPRSRMIRPPKPLRPRRFLMAGRVSIRSTSMRSSRCCAPTG